MGIKLDHLVTMGTKAQMLRVMRGNRAESLLENQNPGQLAAAYVPPSVRERHSSFKPRIRFLLLVAKCVLI